MQYTNINRSGSKILIREVDSQGKKTSRTEFYSPRLFIRVPDSYKTEWKDILGNPVAEKTFKNAWEMSKFIKEYKGLEEMSGNSNPCYQFINDNYSDEFDTKLIDIMFLDIEVNTKIMVNGTIVEGGFPKPDEAKFEVTAICCYSTMLKKYVEFSTAKWSKDESVLSYRDQVIYIPCRDEKEIFRKFFTYFERSYPHIITGWNVLEFDIPYLCNRVKMLFGDKELDRFSPWGIVNEKTSRDNFGNEFSTFEFVGISIIDMIDAYKKYTYKNRESYRLAYIMKCEFDEEECRKMTFEESSYGDLYLNNPQRFIDYNINDVFCVVKIEELLKLMDICMTLSYYAGINIGDNFSTIKVWEGIFYKECMKRKITIPFKKDNPKPVFQGAHVFPTKNGLHKCICSMDFSSLYPSLLRQWNIGYDTFVREPERSRILDYIKNVLAENNDTELIDAIFVKGSIEDYFVEHLEVPHYLTEALKKFNVTLTANCQLFSVDKTSIFSEMTKKIFLERKANKKLMQEYHKEEQRVEKELERRKRNV